MFDDPSFVPPAPISVSIRHTTVPFKPYKKLHSRLLAVILPDAYPGVRKEPEANKNGNDGPPTMPPAKPQESMDQEMEKGQCMVLAEQSQDDG
jgi:hypothetical protein